MTEQPPIVRIVAAEVDQQRVLDFLDGSSFGAAKGGKRIDTHASMVFLGDRALKIKRAVRLPFLDYSTLEKRKRACEEELKVNAVNAPELYRRVVAITRNSDGIFEIDGSGTPVEWAVEMMRFDEKQSLDRVAASRTLDPSLAIGQAAIIPDRNHAIGQEEYATEKVLDGLLRAERDRHADDSDAGKRRGELQAGDRQQAEHGDQREHDLGDPLRQQEQCACAGAPVPQRDDAGVLEAERHQSPEQHAGDDHRHRDGAPRIYVAELQTETQAPHHCDVDNEAQARDKRPAQSSPPDADQEAAVGAGRDTHDEPDQELTDRPEKNDGDDDRPRRRNPLRE